METVSYREAKLYEWEIGCAVAVNAADRVLVAGIGDVRGAPSAEGVSGWT